jgi:hypothetical protein
MPISRKTKLVDVIESGNFDDDDLGDVASVLNAAGRMLDKACSHEITGSLLFRAPDGKFYVGNVEFSIAPANGAYVKDVLKSKMRCSACQHIEDDDAVDDCGNRTCGSCGRPSLKLTEAEIDAMIWPKKTPRNRTSR